MDTQTFIAIPKTDWEELQQTIKFIATEIDPVIRHCGSYKKYLFKKADLLYFLQNNRG